MSTELITPERAQELLDGQIPNRRIRQDYVSRVAADMANGKWKCCPSPISINTDGQLCDGQHRLMAVVKSGVSVYMDVKYGVPKDAIFDRGNPRSAADALLMNGTIDKALASTRISALVNAYLDARYGHRTQREMSDSQKGEFMVKYRDELILVNKVASHGNDNLALTLRAGAQAGLFGAYLAGVAIDTIDKFAKIVNSGLPENGIEDNAALVLRNYLLETKSRGSDAAVRLTKVTECALYDFVRRYPRRKRYSNAEHKYIPDYRIAGNEEVNFDNLRTEARVTANLVKGSDIGGIVDETLF